MGNKDSFMSNELVHNHWSVTAASPCVCHCPKRCVSNVHLKVFNERRRDSMFQCDHLVTMLTFLGSKVCTAIIHTMSYVLAGSRYTFRLQQNTKTAAVNDKGVLKCKQSTNHLELYNVVNNLRLILSVGTLMNNGAEIYLVFHSFRFLVLNFVQAPPLHEGCSRQSM